MYQGRCLSHSTHYPILARLICHSQPAHAKMLSSGSWVKSSKSKGQFCRFLATAVHFREMALLGPGSVATQFHWFAAARPVGSGKADASLHQKNNHIKKKWVKLSHSPFLTIRQSQSVPLTSHSALFAGRPDKGQAPSWRMGKMTFSAGLLTHPRSSLLKKSEPSAKNSFTSAKW